MVTTVSNLNSNAFAGKFGEALLGNFPYFGQSFRATGRALNSVEFEFQATAGDATEFRVLIVTASVAGGTFDPGTVLFESATISRPVMASSEMIKVSVGALALTPGQTYAVIFDARSVNDGDNNEARFPVSTGDKYQDGAFAFLPYASVTGTRAGDFNAPWQVEPDADMVFRLTFFNPGVTVTGTSGNDTIDGSHAPSGQPFATAGDDAISGLGGRDKLFGLDGDDQLSGGKDKDTLTGGGGEDRFVFDVGVKKNPADKIMDFSPIDDTIVLASAKFKALAPGLLADTAFRDIGEAASSADRIVYKASGKLLYDKNGGSNDDAVAFAKLVGAPDISALDFLVV